MGFFAAKWLLPCLAAVCEAQQQSELAVVRGRAIDRDGKPMAKCAVGVFELGQHFSTKDLLAQPLATTDADGRYVLRAKKDYEIVVVAAKDHQVCVQRLQAEASAERALPDALMLPGTTLRGRVRDVNGKPIAGALVRVEDPLTQNWFVTAWFESQAASDERGIFEVPGVPRTGLLVTAGARGFAAVSQLAAHDSPLDLTLRATGIVRGRVVADGKPVAGASVDVATVESCAALGPVTTDGDGRFELTAPNAFRFRIAAYTQRETYRRFSSGLLSGPADDVAVTAEATRSPDARKVTVRCVDATTKAPIEEFFALWSSTDAPSAASLLMSREEKRTPYRGEAVFDVMRAGDNKTNGALLVEAPGHGHAIVRVPDEPGAPLVAELPAECVLTGQVIDDATGKPAVGAAVRALPRSSAMGGCGPDPWKTGAITDANGRYRVTGLAAGEYSVQAYGVGVQAAPSRSVTVTPDKDASLDLAVPKPAYLEFELVGNVPTHSLARILFGGVTTFRLTGAPMLEAPLPLPRFLPLNEQGAYKVGPVGVGEYEVHLWLPTRDRLGSGLTISLGQVTRGKPARLHLPDLTQVLHTGRVRLPSGVPTKRIAVIAHPRTRGNDPLASMRPPVAVCIASDGSFAIDLPPGDYTLQLVDLESKIAFYTEEADRTFDAKAAPIEITPAFRWLHVVFEPTVDKAPIVLQYIEIEVQSTGRGVPAMLGSGSMSRGRQAGWWQFAAGTTELHWLVPETRLTLAAMQTFEVLSPACRSNVGKRVDSIVVQPADDVHATLRIPPPPDDAALVAPPPK